MSADLSSKQRQPFFHFTLMMWMVVFLLVAGLRLISDQGKFLLEACLVLLSLLLLLQLIIALFRRVIAFGRKFIAFKESPKQFIQIYFIYLGVAIASGVMSVYFFQLKLN